MRVSDFLKGIINPPVVTADGQRACPSVVLRAGCNLASASAALAVLFRPRLGAAGINLLLSCLMHTEGKRTLTCFLNALHQSRVLICVEEILCSFSTSGVVFTALIWKIYKNVT